MRWIIILAVLCSLPAGAGAQTNITKASDGAVMVPNRVVICDSEHDSAAVYLSPDTAFNLGYLYEAAHNRTPWPFGSGISIYNLRFQLWHSQVVNHKIYDLSGRCLLNVNTWLEGGQHTFILSGSDDKGGRLPDGFYLYRIATEDTIISKKYYFR